MTPPQSEFRNPQSIRVLILHNRYRQPGGEDVVAAAQENLLREKGHEVRVFYRDNREIDGYGLLRKAALFFQTADNIASAAEIARIAAEFKPHVAHVHNTLPLLSPSIYAPLRKAGVKVIQWLHNYRLVCGAGTLFRDGAPCALCVDDGLKHAVKYKCWTGSTFASLAWTRMIARHRRARTWHTKVDLFVALNTYMRDVLVKKGVVPADKIVVQPNFIEVAHASGLRRNPEDCATNGFVFLGRLTPEKGIASLLAAHSRVTEIPVEIIGGGPEFDRCKPTVEGGALRICGQLPREEALRRLANSRALIFPSLWPEGCPGVIQEAMALGKPVIASRVAGAMELIEDGVNGLLFDPGNAEQLAACMKRLHEDAGFARRLGAAGRAKYEKEFTPEAGYSRLMENYSRLGLASEGMAV